MKSVLPILALAVGLDACASATLSEGEVARFEARIAMPEGAQPLSSYSRYYAPPGIYTEDTLPFTTTQYPIEEWASPQTTPVVVGVFTIPGVWTDDSAGVYIVSRRSLPEPVHGGCWAVNVLIEPSSGRTLAAWCNVGENTPMPPSPEE